MRRRSRLPGRPWQPALCPDAGWRQLLTIIDLGLSSLTCGTAWVFAICMCHEVKRHELAESSIPYGIMATTVSLLYAYLYREVSDILQKLQMVDVQPVEILLRSGTWMFVYSVYFLRTPGCTSGF